jgi:archaellum component FlaC
MDGKQKPEENIDELEARQRQLDNDVKEFKANYDEQRRKVKALKDSLALRNVILEVFKDFSPE